MKRILFIAFLFISFFANSQQRPGTIPAVTNGGYYRLQGVLDTMHMSISIDTFPARYPTFILHPNGNYYSTLGNGTPWHLFASGTGAGTVTNFSFTNTYGLNGVVTNSGTIPNLTATIDSSKWATHKALGDTAFVLRGLIGSLGGSYWNIAGNTLSSTGYLGSLNAQDVNIGANSLNHIITYASGRLDFNTFLAQDINIQSDGAVFITANINIDNGSDLVLNNSAQSNHLQLFNNGKIELASTNSQPINLIGNNGSGLGDGVISVTNSKIALDVSLDDTKQFYGIYNSGSSTNQKYSGISADGDGMYFANWSDDLGSQVKWMQSSRSGTDILEVTLYQRTGLSFRSNDDGQSFSKGLDLMDWSGHFKAVLDSTSTGINVVYQDTDGFLKKTNSSSFLSGYVTLGTAQSISGVKTFANGTVKMASSDLGSPTYGTFVYDNAIAGLGNTTINFKSTAGTTQTVAYLSDITGSTNTSVGGQYRVAITGTNNVKTLQANFGISLDSSTTNIVKIGSDTSVIATKSSAQTLTNKTIAAGSNTITGLTNSNLSGSAGITNANLANSSLTVTAGIDLTGGGAVSLGSSVTVNADTTTGNLKLATQGFVTRNSTSGGLPSTSFTSGSILFRGAAAISQSNSNFFYDSANNQQRIGAASTTYGTASQTPLLLVGNSPSYYQLVIQNTNTGSLASSDIVLQGTDSAKYVNFGFVNGRGASFTIATLNDGYLYSSVGSLAIGTASGKSIKFFQGGTLAANEIARYDSTTHFYGWGTTAPTYAQDISATMNNSFNAIRAINLSNGTAASAVIAIQNDNGGALVLQADGSGVTPSGLFTPSTGRIRSSALLTNGLVIGTGATSPMVLFTGDVEALRITNTQLVNIGGNTSPTGLFSVGSTSSFSVLGTGATTLTSIANSGSYIQSNTSVNTFTGNTSFSGTLTFTGIGSGLSTDSVMTISGAGAVHKRTVANFISSAGALTSSTGFIQGGNSFGTGAEIGTTDNNELTFKTNNISFLKINTSGDLIGGTSPTVKWQLLQDGSASMANNGLSWNTNGRISGYNGVSTTGWGVPAIYGTGRVTAQIAAATVATYTVGASDGDFNVSMNVLITTSTLYNFAGTVTYTSEDNISRTVTLNFSTLAGVLTPTISNTVATTTPYEGVALQIRAKAGTTITLATAGTFTTVTYNSSASIIQID